MLMYLNVSCSLKSVTDVKSDGLPSDGLTKISCTLEDKKIKEFESKLNSFFVLINKSNRYHKESSLGISFSLNQFHH
jgi:hypothetical protein